jgi:Pyruvate/2-oxoacid:ferredoxin oxidoreductase delta subunit
MEEHGPLHVRLLGCILGSNFYCQNLWNRSVCVFFFCKDLYFSKIIISHTVKSCWKWCPRASIQAWTHLILFTNTFCRSPFGKSLCTYTSCWKWCPRASVLTTKSTYRSLSAQRLSECTVYATMKQSWTFRLYWKKKPVNLFT